MGVDYRAYAIIGVQVPAMKLYRLVQERGCMHEFDLSFAYCPTCGRQTYNMVQRPIFDENTDLLDGMVVIRPQSSRVAYIARYVARGDDYHADEHITAFDREQGRKDLRRVLEPLGLWDETLYGLWATLDAS